MPMHSSCSTSAIAASLHSLLPEHELTIKDCSVGSCVAPVLCPTLSYRHSEVDQQTIAQLSVCAEGLRSNASFRTLSSVSSLIASSMTYVIIMMKL